MDSIQFKLECRVTDCAGLFAYLHTYWHIYFTNTSMWKNSLFFPWFIYLKRKRTDFYSYWLVSILRLLDRLVLDTPNQQKHYASMKMMKETYPANKNWYKLASWLQASAHSLLSTSKKDSNWTDSLSAQLIIIIFLVCGSKDGSCRAYWGRCGVFFAWKNRFIRDLGNIRGCVQWRGRHAM